MVIYEPMIIELDELIHKVKYIETKMDDMKLPDAKVIKIPTLYGGEYGPDIQFVAEYNKISSDEVSKDSYFFGVLDLYDRIHAWFSLSRGYE